MPEPVTRWNVTIHREAKKELRRLPRHILQSIMAYIQTLADDSYPEGSGKIQGHSDLYRIRVGDWRVIYVVDSVLHTVTILRVASRGEAYRSL